MATSSVTKVSLMQLTPGTPRLVVHGVFNTKADGTEVPRAVDASNVQITKLNLADKRRVAKLGEAE